MRDILQFLRISSLVIFCLASFQANAKSYKHPGFGNFLEAGAMRLNSFYGDSRINPYIIPRLSNGELTLEAFRLNWDILELGIIQFGPMINYNVSPFLAVMQKLSKEWKEMDLLNMEDLQLLIFLLVNSLFIMQTVQRMEII
jgi:hypothetical protein